MSKDNEGMAIKFKDIEHEAKEELQEEKIVEKKELLKERIREIECAERTLRMLKKQYQKLLDTDVDEVDGCYCF